MQAGRHECATLEGACVCACRWESPSSADQWTTSGMGLSCLRRGFFVVLLMLGASWASVATSQLLGLQYWESRLQRPRLVELYISSGNLNSGLHACVPCILATEPPCFSSPSSSSPPSSSPPPSSAPPPYSTAEVELSHGALFRRGP